jgi:DNA-binding MarR family transcriptional regulator
MHPMFFSVKQTHIAALRKLWPLAAECGLTPARFDLMRVVGLYNDVGIPQWKLVRQLGVAPAVVSRMLRELTKLAFVRRYRDPHDRRVNIVHLTDEGEERIAKAISMHEWGYWLECIACEAFCPPNDYASRATQAILTRARVKLKARAPFQHPWRIASVFDEKLDFLKLQPDDLDAEIPRREIDYADRALARMRAREALGHAAAQPS